MTQGAVPAGDPGPSVQTMDPAVLPAEGTEQLVVFEPVGMVPVPPSYRRSIVATFSAVMPEPPNVNVMKLHSRVSRLLIVRLNAVVE